MRVSATFEDLDNYLNNHSVNMHTVDGKGTITWANETELKSLGFRRMSISGNSSAISTWIRRSSMTFLDD